ncbi:outer membrane beta-barrel protein [Thalassotalea sp. Y01]|uniref:outer membrane beta-barrel protein n=1 Tax=Thalassotalea sp. Y01 TaxID=2729613 RepID=UPI00145F995C|nr:outer membrane beta-barrel protein [Thalassotalea sp. Y01]NMP15176.1 porin family protein [Thalassotalea sp. Y01]
MKKLTTIASLVTLSFASFASAAAESPNWRFIEGSYVSAEVDDSDIDYEPDGFGIAGSTLIGENVILGASYSSVSDDIYGIDVDLMQGEAHLGYRYGATATTDIFGKVSYQYIELEADSESIDDSGYGLHLGVRSMLTPSFELGAEIAHIDIDDETDTILSASAYYHINESFSIGLGYAVADEIDTMSASARLSF